MTDAERALWYLLREAFPEWHFRRQVPIRHYIADFTSHRAKLIIEVHGASKTAIAAVEKAGGTVKILAPAKKDEGEAA